MQNVRPLNEVDPELDKLIADVANGRLLAYVTDTQVFQMRRATQSKSDRVHWPERVVREVEYEPGRNDPCPCGSGKKYKKCCMKG